MPPLSYSYTNGYLTAITHEDGKRTTYAYNANGLLCEIENHDGASLQIDYYNTQEPFRVKQVTYLAKNQAYAAASMNTAIAAPLYPKCIPISMGY